MLAVGLSIVALAGCGGGNGLETTGGGGTTASGPQVTGLTPASSTVASGTSITISGSGFLSASKVTFGGVPALSYVVISDDVITASQPAATGIVDVQVTSPQGTSPLASTDAFTYQPTGHSVHLTGSLGIFGLERGNSQIRRASPSPPTGPSTLQMPGIHA